MRASTSPAANDRGCKCQQRRPTSVTRPPPGVRPAARDQPELAQHDVRMNRLRRHAEAVIRNDHHGRLCADARTIDRGEHACYLSVEKGHRRLRRRRARAILVIDAIECEQVEQHQIGRVPLDDVHRGVGPALVAPRAGRALVKRRDVARSEQAGRNHLLFDRSCIGLGTSGNAHVIVRAL